MRDKRDRGADRDRDMYKKDKYAGEYLKQISKIFKELDLFISFIDKRERSDRGERVARYGDWSEHVSSSGMWMTDITSNLQISNS